MGEGGINMEEIVLEHNGISYTKEDIIKMLDLVMEIVGEEVWSSDLDLNRTITSSSIWCVMMLILYELVLIVKMRNHAQDVVNVKTATMPVPKTNTMMEESEYGYPTFEKH